MGRELTRDLGAAKVSAAALRELKGGAELVLRAGHISLSLGGGDRYKPGSWFPDLDGR